MPILIDGHNLIAQMPTLDLADADDEAQLVLLLRRYATQKRGRRVVVVFDHGVYGHPQHLNGYGVECYFAHSPRDADSELIRRIQRIRQRGQWQVVSSDRAVAAAARTRGVRVISSQVFAQRLQAIPQRQNMSEAPAAPADRPLSEHEIAEWLRLFGAEEEAPDEDTQL